MANQKTGIKLSRHIKGTKQYGRFVISWSTLRTVASAYQARRNGQSASGPTHPYPPPNCLCSPEWPTGRGLRLTPRGSSASGRARPFPVSHSHRSHRRGSPQGKTEVCLSSLTPASNAPSSTGQHRHCGRTQRGNDACNFPWLRGSPAINPRTKDPAMVTWPQPTPC